MLVNDEDPIRSFISKTHIRLLIVEDLPKLCHSLWEIAMFGKFAHFSGPKWANALFVQKKSVFCPTSQTN